MRRYYVDRMVSSVEGMKVLLLDEETTQIVSTVYSQVRAVHLRGAHALGRSTIDLCIGRGSRIRSAGPLPVCQPANPSNPPFK